MPIETGSESLLIWTRLFTTVAYVMAAACLYRGFRNGYRERRAWGIARELFVFSFIGTLLWFVESWAHYQAPYYVYAREFADLLPRMRIDRLVAGIPMFEAKFDPHDGCVQAVQHLQAVQGSQIPLSVVLIEASLVYAALWTARRLTKNLAVQPFLAGLALLAVDALLDPVVAQSFDCTGTLKTGGNGVGLWSWYLPAPADLCREGISKLACSKQLVASFFDIPAFNFAAWLGAPILAIALVNCSPFTRRYIAPRVAKWRIARAPLLSAAIGRVCEPDSRARNDTEGVWGVGLLISAGTILGVVHCAPTVRINPTHQYLVLALGLSVVLTYVVRSFGKYKNDRKVDVFLVVPAVLSVLTSLLVASLVDRFVAQPWLIPVAIIAPLIALGLHWLPYRDALYAFSDAYATIDRFIRLHYFGFPAMLILLGAALFSTDPGTGQIAALLVVALCFQVYAYVMNDLIDLDLDRRQQYRQGDPLVRGRVQPEVAWALVFVSTTVAVMALLLLVEFQAERALWAVGSLGLGFVLMAVYNRWGKSKKNPVPIVTDLLQGLAWGTLPLIGALVANQDLLTADEFWRKPAALIVYGVGYIVLISGVHGGLRDLVNDSRGDAAYTTAMMLGAQARTGADGETHEGDVISSRKIALYAFLVHSAMFAALFAFVVQPAFVNTAGELVFRPERRSILLALLVLLFVAANFELYKVVQRDDPKPNRREWVGWHALLLLSPPMVTFAFADGPALLFKIVVFTSAALPLLFSELVLKKVLDRVFGRRGRIVIRDDDDDDDRHSDGDGASLAA